MNHRRGFALGVFLLLTPLLTVIAWSFVEVGTTTRARAIAEERTVRAYHAAEAGIRYYLTIGQAASFEMNDCSVQIKEFEDRVVSTALVHRSTRTVSISLRLQDGFVTGRETDEDDY